MRQVIDGSERKFSFVYDAGGRRKELNYYKGQETTPSMQTLYVYDNADRLTNIRHLQGANTLENLVYENDANGNRTHFTSNSAQPLRTGITETEYDSANEMLKFTPSTGSAKDMTYDANGNVLSITDACGTTAYTWDVRNRLASISGFKADCSTLTASFKYDALGRRYEKTITDTVHGTRTTAFLYDGPDIIQEKQNGSVTADYMRTLNIDEPLARIKADGTIRHYLQDALGSTIALTDDSGIVKTTYAYDPFGNTTVSGEISDNPFQYTGRENDETGLYYYRARYYSPELQRFISEDPIGLAGGDVNFYTYVGNNPVNFVDPEGLAMTLQEWSSASTTMTNIASTNPQYEKDLVCNTFVQKVYGKVGKGSSVTGRANDIHQSSLKAGLVFTDRKKLSSGDLIYFSRNGKTISHIGIYRETDTKGNIIFSHMAGTGVILKQSELGKAERGSNITWGSIIRGFSSH